MMAKQAPRYQTFITAHLCIIGGGGIGSAVGPFAAKAGVASVDLYDPDTFAPVNLQVQHVNERDLGRNKAEVVAEYMHALNPTIDIRVKKRRFSRGNRLDGIVIAAVHSIETRRMIFDEVLRQKHRVSLYLDGRLSRAYHEYFELFAIDPNDDIQVAEYRKWLYPGKTFPKEPRPTQLAAHTPYGLAWAFGCVFARLNEGKHRPWRIVGDGVSGTVESYYVENLKPAEGSVT
jgi:hypothetical protein